MHVKQINITNTQFNYHTLDVIIDYVPLSAINSVYETYNNIVIVKCDYTTDRKTSEMIGKCIKNKLGSSNVSFTYDTNEPYSENNR